MCSERNIVVSLLYNKLRYKSFCEIWLVFMISYGTDVALVVHSSTLETKNVSAKSGWFYDFIW